MFGKFGNLFASEQWVLAQSGPSLGVSLLLFAVALAAVGLAVIFLIHRLATKNILFTFVKEGQAKVVLLNGVFYKALISWKGYGFRHKVENDFEERAKQDRKKRDEKRAALREGYRGRIEAADSSKERDELRKERDDKLNELSHEEEQDELSGWDNVRDPNWRPPLELIGGLRFVGIPKLYTIHTSRFKWSNLEANKERKKPEDPAMIIVTKEVDNMDHLLIQDDTYTFELEGAETIDLIGLNFVFLITVSVENVRKAGFGVHNWLETTTNVLASRVREFIGTMTLEKIINLREGGKKKEEGDESTPDDESLKEGLKGLTWAIEQVLKDDIRRVRIRYGVVVHMFQVHSVTHTNKEAQQAAISAFVEQRKGKGLIAKAKAEAEAIETVAKAETQRVTSVYAAAAGIEGGRDMFIAEQIRQSKLLSLSSGGGAIPLLPLPMPTEDSKEKTPPTGEKPEEEKGEEERGGEKPAEDKDVSGKKPEEKPKTAERKKDRKHH